MPDDDMGKAEVSQGGGSITNETFDEIAKKWKITPEEAKRNTLEELKKQLGEE